MLNKEFIIGTKVSLGEEFVVVVTPLYEVFHTAMKKPLRF